MILWLTGNTGAGKTTLAHKLIRQRTVHLDGDEMREVNQDMDLSADGRWNNCLRIARLAKLLEEQGFDVVVSVICPYEALRNAVRDITECVFVYLPYAGDDAKPASPYERPENVEIVHRRENA